MGKLFPLRTLPIASATTDGIGEGVKHAGISVPVSYTVDIRRVSPEQFEGKSVAFSLRVSGRVHRMEGEPGST